MAVLVLLAGMGVRAAQTITISNPLGLKWPWELVHVDLPAESVAGDVSVRMGDETRPAQVQRIEEDGKRLARVWFMATVTGNSADVIIEQGRTASPLTLVPSADRLTVDNGLYEFQVPNFPGRFAATRRMADVSPILAGMRVKGDMAGYYGRSWFEGDLQVAGAKTEVLEQGPVYTTVRVSYDIAPQAGDTAKRFYEATLRFVVNDPWVEVTERYNMPKGTAYWLELKENLRPDNVMWVRWFDYVKFGGNNRMNFVPLQPQPMQRGPFVMLQPRWTQLPGAGQDFFVTRGGEKDADPNAPAVGIVATGMMRWVNPYEQVINAYAENGDTARIQFPLGDGGKVATDGGRAYAVCVGPRAQFDNTGKLNAMVRRHADWTLDNQMNKYILEWPRDPKLATPHILMTEEEIAQIRRDYQAGVDAPQMRILRSYIARRAELKAADQQLLDFIVDGKTPQVGLPSATNWLSTRYQDDYLNPTTYTRTAKAGFAKPDLFRDGQPIGGPWQAALGYLASDLNQWPGYHNGFNPGNPNFHTDKYMIALLAAAMMPDHPHAKQWLAFGKDNFDEDTGKVLTQPDGVGYECPGYSTYSLGLQLETAKVLKNVGYGNPVAENPMFKKTGIWHRQLLTPVDCRIGIRHQTPVGDTHRWGQNDGAMFGKLAKFYKDADPQFASEMMGIYQLYREQGERDDLLTELVDIDQSIPAMPIEKMAWGSQAFENFGAILRSRFGAPRETFASFKAGRVTGHYHNDDLSYHFYGAGTPISLDYNCSYHPRGDNAALHNSMTFGYAKPFTHIGSDKAVPATEQIYGTATVGAFAGTAVADAVVAERKADTVTMTPIYPDDAMFHYNYPTRKVDPIVHRRYLVLVKHAANSRLEDYLVIRDETQSKEPQQINIHLLARDVQQTGQFIRATGQWDADATIFLAKAQVSKVDVGRWFYFDEKSGGPEKLTPEAWKQQIEDTDGQALIPPVGWQDKWTFGEYQKWVKVETAPGSPALWVLYARKRGEPEPKFETLADGSGVRVTLGNEVDEVFVNTVPAAGVNGQVVIRQNGKETVVLAPHAVPALGGIQQ